MTNSVNKVPLSSVEETTSDKSKEVDEFDVVDDFDTNYILEGAEELEQIEFNVLVNEISHPENLDIDSQIKEIKSLSNKDVSENTFVINNKRGFISVENISISEEGNVSNLREITISGKFLPWPKYFPENKPKKFIFLFLFDKLNFNFDSISDLELLTTLISNINANLKTDSNINLITSFNGNFNGVLTDDGESGGYGISYGDSYGVGDGVGIRLSLIHSILGQSFYELNLNGEVKIINKISLETSSFYIGSLQGDMEIASVGYGESYGSNYGG